jgi:hypothetical protein
MKDPIIFDQLVKELNNQERRALLVRIQSSVPVYSQPLNPESEASGFVPEVELAELNVFERIFLFFKSLFTHKDRTTLLRKRYLRRLTVEIERNNPTLIHGSKSRFQAGMYEELRELKERARILHGPLQEVLGDSRREFIAFLARDEFKDFQERLNEATNPQVIWENSNLAEEKQVRTLMLQRFDELIDTIPESSKRGLARDARAFYALYAFSLHPFDALLFAFRGKDDLTADFADLNKPLKELAETLKPVRFPPSPRALYDLFLFLHQERLGERDFDLEDQLMIDMSNVHAALAGIRKFHERVPLHMILHLVTQDPEYYPSARRSIPDWFTFYRDFWRQWVHRRYLDFYHSRRRGALRSKSLEFLNVKSLPSLANYRANKFGRNTPVQHEFSLCFIKGFLKHIFAPLSRALKLIYLNGEFYKEENRHAYTDAFLILAEADQKIEELESILGPQGELRSAIQGVKGQALGERLRQKRILDILARADGEARALLDVLIEQIENLRALLHGILKGQPGDRYDTLVNLNKIGGRENSDLRKTWTSALEKAEQGAVLLKKIRELEINQYA